MLASLVTQNWEDPVSGYWLMWLACLRLWLRLGLRSRLAFFGSRWLVFLLSWRLRFFCWSRFCFLRRRGFGFFLLLSRFRFGLLFCGRFGCLSCWRSRLLLLSLLLCDSLILRKHPVLQVRRNDICRFSVLINLNHAGSGGSSSPRRNTLHKDSVDRCLEVFRGELPHSQPVRRSCPFVVNN